MDPKIILIKAVENALDTANPTLKSLLAFYLKNNINADLSLAYTDPTVFKQFLTKFFGEYSCKLLEIMIIKNLDEILGLPYKCETLEDVVNVLKKTLGE